MAPMIYPNDRGDAGDVARRLLDAAGPGRRDEVRTVTEGPAGIAFEVPEDVYERAFIVEPAVAPSDPAPVRPAAEQPVAAVQEPESDPAVTDGAPVVADDAAVVEPTAAPSRRRRPA